MRTAVNILVNGIGVYLTSLAARPAIEFQGKGLGLILTIAVVGLLFGLFNTYVVRARASWPVIVLITFAGNATLLWLVAIGTDHLTNRLHIEGFWPVAVGGLIATTVAIALQVLLPTRTRTKELV
ncbi:hypothetical protein AB0E69_21290 [Kribbella sp. NPDC026611]|uniref:hypothetical protein n=1 Tax=Kribbella sp. NPDC026611 TaxID=3154911 RepID=UPI0033FF50ED